MIRAIQTADIIRKHLDGELSVEMDDILKEGAPVIDSLKFINFQTYKTPF